MKSPSEEFSRFQFDLFLRKLFASEAITWTPVPLVEEPPDYFLDLDGTRFAVEVTIMIKKVAVGAKRPRSLRVITDELSQWVEQVEQIARSHNCLHGRYLVSIRKPIDNFANVKNEIRRNLLEYIRTTQNLGCVPERVIFEHGRQKCTIEKLDDDQDKVVHSGMWETAWEADAIEEMCQLLNERIDKKASKLGNLPQSKILLLHNKYALAPSSKFRDCISKVPAIASFHTVFIAQLDEPSFVLHSQADSWLNSPPL